MSAPAEDPAEERDRLELMLRNTHSGHGGRRSSAAPL